MLATVGAAAPWNFTADDGAIWQGRPQRAAALSLPAPISMFGLPGQAPTRQWHYDYLLDEPLWLGRPLPARPLALLTSGGVRAGDTIVLTGVPINVPLYYEPPNAHWLTSSYLARPAINANAAFAGVQFGNNFLAIGDLLNDPDILGLTETSQIEGWVEIATAVNVPSTPNPQWSPWQQFSPGVFPGAAWKLRVGMQSNSPAAEPQCSAFSFATQIPTRTDNYVNQAVPNTGLTIVFTPDGSLSAQPFNAGVNGNTLPKYQVDWQNTTGDSYTVTGLPLSQLTIQFFNGGVGVARTATIVVQGA